MNNAIKQKMLSMIPQMASLQEEIKYVIEYVTDDADTWLSEEFDKDSLNEWTCMLRAMEKCVAEMEEHRRL